MAKSQTFTELSDFIRNRMRKNHIYQPVMLMELLRSGGKASVVDIAKAILGYDASQVEYYSERTKQMVGKVLTDNNHITERIKVGRNIIGYRISNADELSSEETTELINLCQSSIDQFLDDRGAKIWSHRRRSSGYVPGTVRYQVLKRAKLRCKLQHSLTWLVCLLYSSYYLHNRKTIHSTFTRRNAYPLCFL